MVTWVRTPIGILILDWFSRFYVHSSKAPNVFEWAEQPQKLPFIFGHLDPLSNAWFLGPTRVSRSNSISIGSAAFAGLTNVTNRQSQRQTQCFFQHSGSEWKLQMFRMAVSVVLAFFSIDAFALSFRALP